MSVAGPIPPRSIAPLAERRARPAADRRILPSLAAGSPPIRRVAVVMLSGALASTAGLMPVTDRLLYIHVPAAIDTFIACGAVFAAGLLYLITHRPRWERIMAASALTALLFCSAVLVSGMFWARDAWGRWWVWSPRLTFSFVLWLLYAGFFAVRAVAPGSRRGAVCAVYGVIAFLDVPLVWLSVKLLPDIHPETVQSSGGSGALILGWLAALTALATGANLLAIAGPGAARAPVSPATVS